MGRVMAEPGRGPHDKLSKALEGIGKLKGDKIEEKRKNFPCNQTALQAVVSFCTLDLRGDFLATKTSRRRWNRI